jgi:nucleotide-binding universal stress UspA family protein
VKLRSILVPLDGSAYAEGALALAVELAARAGARLRLVLVHEVRGFAAAGDQGAAAGLKILEGARAYLDATAERLAGEAGVRVEGELCEGVPGAALVASAGSHADDLVVMATHGRGPVSRLWLGSVADYTVRHAVTPVLLVRSREGGAGQAPPLRRALVALDGSERSERIVEAALAVMGPDPHLSLVTVIQPVIGVAQPAVPFPVPMVPAVVEELGRTARNRLDRVVEKLERGGIRAEARVLTGVAAAPALLEESESGRYDLIALTTRGAGGVQRALLGSVADKVVRGAALPVLVWSGGRE